MAGCRTAVESFNRDLFIAKLLIDARTLLVILLDLLGIEMWMIADRRIIMTVCRWPIGRAEKRSCP